MAKDKAVNIRMTQSMYDELQKLAWSEKRSVSSTIVLLLKQQLNYLSYKDRMLTTLSPIDQERIDKLIKIANINWLND